MTHSTCHESESIAQANGSSVCQKYQVGLLQDAW